MSPADDIFEAPTGGFRFGPVHPGRTLADELKARNLTAHALALKLRVPANRITEIIQGKRGISAETALRLGRYFGTGAPFWLALQSQYDLETAERELGARIAAEVEQAA
jgi:addiction module HigA family antidote